MSQPEPAEDHKNICSIRSLHYNLVILCTPLAAPNVSNCRFPVSQLIKNSRNEKNSIFLQKNVDKV
jgi:hypothetical protein